MNTRGMNHFLHPMNYRALKHGSEEEYEIFKEIAICRAKNGAADSRLQLEHATPVVVGGDGGNPAAIAQHAGGDLGDVSCKGPDDASICEADGKRSECENGTTATPVKTAAKDYEVKEISKPVGEDHVCSQADESIRPDPSTSSDFAETHSHGPSEECSNFTRR